jgi:hypothetical protein
MIYLVSISEPIICKYSFTGEYLGHIIFVESPWNEILVRILDYEIIMSSDMRIKYYDFEGRLLRSTKKIYGFVSRFMVTQNNIYIMNNAGAMKMYERKIP